jgi:mono/diheme cytochrome c family protein
VVCALLFAALMIHGLSSLQAKVAAIPLQSRKVVLGTGVRLSISLATLVATVGCTGYIDGGSTSGLPPKQAIARHKFEDQAFPIFEQNCAACHDGGRGPEIAFLSGASSSEIRDTLMNFNPQVVNTDAPPSSRVLTKGSHDGPALNSQQSSAILEWIQAEQAASPQAGDTGATIEKFIPVLCTAGAAGDPTCPYNTLDLTSLGLAGAEIRFIWQSLGADSAYVNQLKLVAAGDGAYIEHPLFVSWPPDGSEVPDSLDRFFDVKLNLMEGASELIDGGTAAFIGFAPIDKISIHFKVVMPYQPEQMGTVPSGCRQLQSFKTRAQQPLKTNCASCHAGTANAKAKAAMDLDGIDANADAVIQLACNQARTVVNFQNTAQSGLYLAPNPASRTNHPFKFGGSPAYNAFETAVDIWVQAEKTSP